MSTDINSLIFFDKEGYPYNFQYDEDNKMWGGKIFFDENSSDTFRTLCLYLFENVSAFDFDGEFEFLPSELFNWSGMTFIGETYINEPISGITKVNSSTNFYSKWIRGDRFDKKFPVGTLVTFSGVTGSGDNDFSDGLIYNVLGTQKNSLLISTQTSNSGFSFTFSGGTISSLNAIKVSDCGQGLVDINGLNYYNGKKLSVVGSTSNDAIYTYDTGYTLKTSFYDFLLTPEIQSKLVLEFDLLTQRPELYEGIVNITYNTDEPTDYTGTTIEFVNGINTSIDFIETGQTIIFEYSNGEPIMPQNLEFTITGYIDREVILTGATLNFFMNEEINTIETPSGTTSLSGLTYNDIIEITSLTYLSGYTFHNKRQFQVTEILNNLIQVREYIIPESGFTYKIEKVINKKKIKKVYCKGLPTLGPLSPFSGYTICYSTTNHIKMTQDVLNSGSTEYYYENTLSAMRNKYRNLLNRYGIDIYHLNYLNNNYLIFDGQDYTHNQIYSGLTAKLVDSSGTTVSGLTISNNFNSGLTDSNSYYFEVDEQLTKEKIYIYDSAKLSRNFRLETYFDIQRDSTNYGFKAKLNGTEYYIDLSGTSISGVTTYSRDTITNFINTYGDIFNSNGYTVLSGYTTDIYTGYTLIITGEKPNVDLYDFEVKVNSYSTYDVIDNYPNNSIVISSNELKIGGGIDLRDLELSTGMIINVSGATSIFNNKQYNILKLTGNTTLLDTIQLSYQGPFEYEDTKTLFISVNSFLRKPRGTYDMTYQINNNGTLETITENRDINYKFSWFPIEENNPKINPNIFYYDYSGDQLGYNGAITYTGPKPLWIDSSSMVFLNSEPNKNTDRVNDPQSQQTVFDSLNFKLENLDSSVAYDYVPSPLQVFVGFNSKIEGVTVNNMIIEKIDNIIFSGTTTNNQIFTISGDTITYTVLSGSTLNFHQLGFNTDQLITIDFKDRVLTGHTLFTDYDIYEIIDVTDTKIRVNGNLHTFISTGRTYDFVIKSEPVIIASFYIYGQTEVEDLRFVNHLKLLGAGLDSSIQAVFKESDINDMGIDFTILNKKRKELLSVYPEIYNYIGSYKSLINAINFFGYNDLDLYEYYRNIRPNSPLYGKLQKTLIEDVFINTIPGWEEMEMDSNNFLKTNLFNLTYKITDFEGNYLNLYSLDEVQRKLTVMVNWLRKNVIPLSANILDVTGVANTRATLYSNYNSSNNIKKTTLYQTSVAINFNYIQTLNIDNDYLFTINFYLTSGATMPDYFSVKIKTFRLDESTNELIPVQYMDLYKRDLLSYSFNVDRRMEPYMYIETQSFNDYGLGYTNSKLFNFNEGRNFVLIDNNFTGVNYKYLTTDYGFYIITEGRFYIIPY